MRTNKNSFARPIEDNTVMLALEIRTVVMHSGFRVHINVPTKTSDRTILRLQTYYGVGCLCNWHYPVPECTQRYLGYR